MNDDVASASLGSPENPETIALTEIMDALERAWALDKTPLFLDRSKHDLTGTFFSYQSNVVILEAKKMGLDKAMKKRKVDDIMNDARKTVVNCLKYNHQLCLHLANGATDFVGTFNDNALGLDGTQACFPIEIFASGGRKLSTVANAWSERLWREEDREQGQICVRMANAAPFVFLTSQFHRDSFEKFLWKDSGYGLPWPKDQFYVFWIEHTPGTELL